MKNKIRILLIIILLILSLIISITIYNKHILSIDVIAYKLLVEHLRTPELTHIMKLITSLANANTILTISIFTSILIFQKNKKLSLIIPLNLIIITLINQTIKLLIKRPRPEGYRLIDINGYSFPSGHAMISVAFYGLLIYIINKTIKNKKIKTTINIIILLIILLIGISRIYLGVHYLSDILVGYLLSIIYLLIITNILDNYIFK